MHSYTFSFFFPSKKVGFLTLTEVDKCLTAAHYFTFVKIPVKQAPSPLLREAEQQIIAYFSGKLQQFSLPLAPVGTVFQQKVWQALQKLPYGTTTTYGALAKHIGSPNAARAVGGANNKNPIGIIIPCHRVIGSNGGLVGYAEGLAMKQELLLLEAAVAQKN